MLYYIAKYVIVSYLYLHKNIDMQPIALFVLLIL